MSTNGIRKISNNFGLSLEHFTAFLRIGETSKDCFINCALEKSKEQTAHQCIINLPYLINLKWENEENCTQQAELK